MLVLFAICLVPLLVMGLLHIFSWIAGAFSDTDTFMMLLREDYWTVLAGALCIVGGMVLLLYIIKGWGNLWAVARKMILEALNRKVVLILLLFFVILMPSLSFILKTEGSLKSQVQIVLTYSLALAMVLLSVLAIFVCTASVCSEIARKQVHITDTKPLQRSQFLMGKLMGVTILCGVLLFLMSGAVYGIVNYMARDRAFSGVPSWERREKEIDLRRVRNEVLVARHTARPLQLDVSENVERTLKARRERGEITTDAEEAQLREELKARARRRQTTAPARGRTRFTFSGLEPGTENPAFLRVLPHLTNPDADLEPGVWRFVQGRRTEDGDLRWEEVGVFRQQLTPGSFQEISIDPRMIDRNGLLHFSYENPSPRTGVYFNPEGGIEVMQKVGGFATNYYRSVLVVLAHIVLLAAMSIMLGAVFSFPVASFCVASMLIIGLLGPWVAEHALAITHPEGLPVLSLFFRQGMYSVLRAILTVAPQFARFSPIELVANGRLVGLGYTARALAVMCFLQGGLAMLLASYLYRRRELAKIIA